MYGYKDSTFHQPTNKINGILRIMCASLLTWEESRWIWQVRQQQICSCFFGWGKV